MKKINRYFFLKELDGSKCIKDINPSLYTINRSYLRDTSLKCSSDMVSLVALRFKVDKIHKVFYLKEDMGLSEHQIVDLVNRSDFFNWAGTREKICLFLKKGETIATIVPGRKRHKITFNTIRKKVWSIEEMLTYILPISFT